MSGRLTSSSRNVPPEFIVDACNAAIGEGGGSLHPELLRLLRNGEASVEELQQVSTAT